MGGGGCSVHVAHCSEHFAVGEAEEAEDDDDDDDDDDAKDDDDDDDVVELRCRVEEQKEYVDGLKDEVCGKVAGEGQAGLCK